MSDQDNWLLPEGIEELIPPQAELLEQLRRSLLDCYRSWGYELVMPPFIEYLESLLTGTGKDLDLQTFKLMDPMTGRTMGVRADMTPQAARIDAHLLKRDAPVRLCYLGTVLRTHPDGFAGSRTPLQVGAELYGHSGVESDLEILLLMLETLTLTGIEDVHIDLGHVSIFRGLTQQAGLDAGQESVLFDALQRKAVPEINELLAGMSLAETSSRMLASLAGLHGGVEILEQARTELKDADAGVIAALDELMQMADMLKQQKPGLKLHFDLAELRGYHFHNGIVYAAFVPGHGQEIARGGRYDDIGKVFGRARAATGFSADLKTLITLSGKLPQPQIDNGIYAPRDDDPVLQEKISTLRQQGEKVICALSGQNGIAREVGCDRELVNTNGKWSVTKIKD